MLLGLIFQLSNFLVLSIVMFISIVTHADTKQDVYAKISATKKVQDEY